MLTAGRESLLPGEKDKKKRKDIRIASGREGVGPD